MKSNKSTFTWYEYPKIKVTNEQINVNLSTCLSSPDEPVVTKRVRTVIEEVVDGKVVSRTEDVDVLSK